jgi:hypothetical protein
VVRGYLSEVRKIAIAFLNEGKPVIPVWLDVKVAIASLDEGKNYI